MSNEYNTSQINASTAVVFDTCCIVNMAAIDGHLACLASLGLTCWVPTAVQAEGIYIRSTPDATAVHRIDLNAAMSSGTVRICSLEGYREHELYVNFVLGLDGGEAMALAVAKSRAWKLATDDRKARRTAQSVGVRVVTTPQLVRWWATATGHSKQQIADVLRRIETLARFVPADDSDATRWWRQIVATYPAT